MHLFPIPLLPPREKVAESILRYPIRKLWWINKRYPETILRESIATPPYKSSCRPKLEIAENLKMSYKRVVRSNVEDFMREPPKKYF